MSARTTPAQLSRTLELAWKRDDERLASLATEELMREIEAAYARGEQKRLVELQAIFRSHGGLVTRTSPGPPPRVVPSRSRSPQRERNFIRGRWRGDTERQSASASQGGRSGNTPRATSSRPSWLLSGPKRTLRERGTLEHEAAHVACALALGWEVQGVNVAPPDVGGDDKFRVNGYVELVSPEGLDPFGREHAEQFAVICYGGRAATRWLSDDVGHLADEKHAEDALAAVGLTTIADRARLRQRAEELVRRHDVRAMIDVLEQALEHHDELDGREIVELLAYGKPPGASWFLT